MRFLNGQEVLFIDYSGSKYARSAPKIALTWKALFRVVENGKFPKRLRNGRLEKSAATGLFRPSRSPMTAKVPLKVHLRLRFQNPGKPRTAGLCGREGSLCDHLSLSCFYRTGRSPAHPPAAGVKGGANSADACPGCGDAATAPKAADSGFRGVKLVRLRRGAVPTLGLCFALPKNPGPGVTGA